VIHSQFQRATGETNLRRFGMPKGYTQLPAGLLHTGATEFFNVQQICYPKNTNAKLAKQIEAKETGSGKATRPPLIAPEDEHVNYTRQKAGAKIAEIQKQNGTIKMATRSIMLQTTLRFCVLDAT